MHMGSEQRIVAAEINGGGNPCGPHSRRRQIPDQCRRPYISWREGCGWSHLWCLVVPPDQAVEVGREVLDLKEDIVMVGGMT